MIDATSGPGRTSAAPGMDEQGPEAANGKKRIFLSYSSSDRHRVEGLERLLVLLGHQVFMAHRTIGIGLRWEDELERALKSTDAVMVFWTRAASRSKWVRREYEYFLTHDRDRPLVPIRGDDTPLAKPLEARQELDFVPLLNELVSVKRRMAAEGASREAIQSTMVERLRKAGVELDEADRAKVFRYLRVVGFLGYLAAPLVILQWLGRTVTEAVTETTPAQAGVAAATVIGVATLAGGGKQPSLGGGIAFLRVPTVRADGQYIALAGRGVLLKAALEPRPGREYEHRWSFGDGSDSELRAVRRTHVIQAVHAYEDGTPGTRYDARLLVRDVRSGETAHLQVPIRFVDPTPENKRTIAIDDGLWALHASMSRTSDQAWGSVGGWGTHGYPLAKNAMAALAFQANDTNASTDQRRNPYQETVDRALRWIFRHLREYDLGKDPTHDFNGNGAGLTITRERSRAMYQLPMIAVALLASRDPDRVALEGLDPVTRASLRRSPGDGVPRAAVPWRTYRDIVSDLLDTMTAGQNPDTGGWSYEPGDKDPRTDMSIVQWPVLAFQAAEDLWHLDTPESVRSGVSKLLEATTQDDGGIRYGAAGTTVTVACSASGLLCQGFLGRSASDDAVSRTVAYIGGNWDAASSGDLYTMFGVMKGARLMTPPIEKFGDHDWRSEYVDKLFEAQSIPGTAVSKGSAQFGSWPSQGKLDVSLATSFAILTLSDDVVAPRPSKGGSAIWWVLGGAAAVGGTTVLVRRRKRAG